MSKVDEILLDICSDLIRIRADKDLTNVQYFIEKDKLITQAKASLRQMIEGLKKPLGKKPEEEALKLATAIHSLFTSYLDSLAEGFPKKKYAFGLYNSGFNQALSLCKSYHIKVVAEKDLMIKMKQDDWLEVCKENDELEIKLKQKDKEIETLFHHEIENFKLTIEIERLRGVLNSIASGKHPQKRCVEIAKEALEGK